MALALGDRAAGELPFVVPVVVRHQHGPMPDARANKSYAALRALAVTADGTRTFIEVDSLEQAAGPASRMVLSAFSSPAPERGPARRAVEKPRERPEPLSPTDAL